MALAIQTRNLGPTDHRDRRIVAETMDTASPDRVTVLWNEDLEPLENHRAALNALLDSVTDTVGGPVEGSIWAQPERWMSGGTRQGYVWVFVPGT